MLLKRQSCKHELPDLANEAEDDRDMPACALQEKEQALISISENARRHIERSRAERARTYDTLLGQYRQGYSNLTRSCTAVHMQALK